ncbi:MAG TPA: hypothetical protein VMS18_21835 [Candidatus Binatia bacterium]|nr:hypothetical protein [Candidatus Binatia bacterium]
MQKPDPCFSHLSQDPREEVFERLKNALNDMATYFPMTAQHPYWKNFIFKCLGCEKCATWWMDDYSFPVVEDCFESVLKELPTISRIALLDPRLQIEVVPLDGGDFPTWACRVHHHEGIKRKLEVRPDTGILLLLSQPAIEHLPREAVIEDLRHELGHVLLYLRDPEATDDCSAADEEWKRCTQPEDLTVRIPLRPLNKGE